MAKEIYEMMQERAKITAQLREVMNRNDAEEMNADDKATYDRLEKEFDKLNASITREQKQLERERAAGEVADVQRDDAKNKIVDMFGRALRGDQGDIAAYRNTTQTLGTNANAG